jgi:hypothetical protein
MDPNLYLVADVSVELTSTEANVNVFNDVMNLGLRSFPLTSQFIKTCNIEIDGNGVDVNLSEIQKHLINYVYSDEELKQQNTTTPALITDSFGTVFFQGTASNPLGTIREISYSAIPSRGSFPYKSIYYPGATSNTALTSGSFTSTLCEVLPISPLSLKSAQYDTDPLYNVSNLKININWNSSAECFSKGFCKNVVTDAATSDVVYTIAVNGTVTAAPGYGVVADKVVTGKIVVKNINLLVGFYTPEITQTIPETLFLDYKKFLYFNQTAQCPIRTYNTTNVLNTRAFSTSLPSLLINLNNIQLSQVPRWVMFCVYNDGPYSVSGAQLPYYSQTNLYCPIYNVDLTVGNDSGILSTCSPQNLYQMNVKNGLKNISWATSGMHGQMMPSSSVYTNATNAPANSGVAIRFLTPIGCPLKLMFGEDIQMTDPLLAPGVSSNLNFTANIRIYLPYVNDAALNLKVMTIFCLDGVCTISRDQGGVYFSTSIIDKQDVIESVNNPIDGSMLDSRTYGDGSFLKKLKKFARSAMRAAPGIVNKGLDFVEKNKGTIGKVAETAAMLAAGNGGVLVAGGSQMSRNQLKRRIQMK